MPNQTVMERAPTGYLGRRFVDIEKYLPLLCDPLTKEPLEISKSDVDGAPPKIFAAESRREYGFVGDFPDLRPWADKDARDAATRDEIDSFACQRSVAAHYDDKPCNNYLCLDNVPLGKYLRDSHYDELFSEAKFVVEVGCGKGAIARAFREYRGITPFCVDIAPGSINQIRRPPLSADGILGSNIALPLCDAAADMVVSYGVIHHTPNPFQCFRELTRILKPGGYLLLNVYNWENLYRKLYHAFNPPLATVRERLGQKWGDRLLQATLFPPYHLALWGILGLTQGNWRFPSLRDSWEQFGDFFLTPIARFYHREELASMGDALGLDVVESSTGGWPKNGFSHFVWYRKRPAIKTALSRAA